MVKEKNVNHNLGLTTRALGWLAVHCFIVVVERKVHQLTISAVKLVTNRSTLGQ